MKTVAAWNGGYMEDSTVKSRRTLQGEGDMLCLEHNGVYTGIYI